jgi:hypothetical protein
MTKLSIGTISNPAFMAVMQELLTKPLRAKTCWKIKTLVNTFNAELKKYSELRREILERHCEKGEDGKPLLDEQQNYKFSSETMVNVTQEIGELHSIEVEIEPISLDEIEDAQMTTQQIFDLGALLHA